MVWDCWRGMGDGRLIKLVTCLSWSHVAVGHYADRISEITGMMRQCPVHITRWYPTSACNDRLRGEQGAWLRDLRLGRPASRSGWITGHGVTRAAPDRRPGPW